MPNINLSFTPPSPLPVNYTVAYRLVNTTPYTYFTSSGNTSPITITDVAAGQYEGHIIANCTGGSVSSQVDFAVTVTASQPPVWYLRQSSENAAGGESVPVFCGGENGTNTTARTSRLYSFFQDAQGYIPLDVTGGDYFISFDETQTGPDADPAGTYEWHTPLGSLTGVSEEILVNEEVTTYTCNNGYITNSLERILRPHPTYVIIT